MLFRVGLFFSFLFLINYYFPTFNLNLILFYSNESPCQISVHLESVHSEKVK